MLPNCKIVISPNGDHQIIGLEKTENCHKLSELGRSAGKVKSDVDEDHPPVHQQTHVGKK